MSPVGPRGSQEAAPLSQVSEVVHQRNRLAIVALLYEAGEADFTEIRHVTGMTDGNLSRHLAALEEAGLVDVQKGFRGRRPRTTVQLTRAGRDAFEHEVRILRSIVEGAEKAQKRGAAAVRPATAR